MRAGLILRVAGGRGLLGAVGGICAAILAAVHVVINTGSAIGTFHKALTLFFDWWVGCFGGLPEIGLLAESYYSAEPSRSSTLVTQRIAVALNADRIRAASG